MSLPTFSELMASLQLTSKGEPETGVEDHPSASETSPGPSSPASSTSFSPEAACQHLPSNTDSPSIIVSQFDSSRTARTGEPRAQKSLGRSNRFAPYLGTAPTTQIRRGSLSSVPADMPERRDVPDRACSASPQMRSSALQDANINATRPPQRPRKLQDINPESDVPISSFVRRHTPQSSPTASTFPHRRRSNSSQNSLTPVILPTLLPGLTPSSPPHSADDMEVSETEDLPPLHVQDSPKPRNRHQGLRLSSYRADSRMLEDVVTASVRSAA